MGEGDRVSPDSFVQPQPTSCCGVISHVRLGIRAILLRHWTDLQDDFRITVGVGRSLPLSTDLVGASLFPGAVPSCHPVCSRTLSVPPRPHGGGWRGLSGDDSGVLPSPMTPKVKPLHAAEMNLLTGRGRCLCLDDLAHSCDTKHPSSLLERSASKNNR